MRWIKKYILLITFCFASFLVFSGLVAEFGGDQVFASNWSDAGKYSSAFAGGNGTSTEPYLISTPMQFARFGIITKTHTGTLCFKLMNSIDMSQNNWIPVENSNMNNGSGSARVNFDGNACTIYSLKSVNDASGGLFRWFKGNFYNCQFRDAYINNISAAIITDQLYGSIENIQARGNVISKNNYAGGILVYNQVGSTVRNCSYIGDVTGATNSISLRETNKYSHKATLNLSVEGQGIGFLRTYIKVSQKVFFKDVQQSTFSFSDVFCVSGIAGSNLGTLIDCYFVGAINGYCSSAAIKTITHEDDAGKMSYRNVYCQDAEKVNNTEPSASGRRAFIWDHFTIFGGSTSEDVKSIVNSKFGCSISSGNSSKELANETNLDSLAMSKQSYTTETIVLSGTIEARPYNMGAGTGTVTNCYYQTSTQGLNETPGSKKATNMKVQTISLAWAIDASINDGYPHLKNFYWQDQA